MQQRRGTAAQWTSYNPILNTGEIGYESDTNKFKIGDGTNHWADLSYFVDADTLIDGAPGLLDTLNELAAAIGDDPAFFTTVATNLSNHQSDTTNIHGIADTAELATKTFAAELLTNATKSNITITGDKNGLTITAENGVADSTTDNLTEGSTNKYFTDERAQDAIGNNVGTGLSYNDSTGAISVTANTYDSYGSASAVAGDLSSHASDTTTHGTTGDIVGTSDTQTLTNKTLTSPKINENVELTATATELNTLDGITASTAELNILDGVSASASEINTLDGITASTAELNILDGVTATTEEINTLDGITASTAELNILDGVTASTSEINILDGATLSTTELNYVDGVTSSIQTQIDSKAPSASPTFTGTVTTGDLVINGDVTVNSGEFLASATSIVIDDNLVQLAHGNSANTVDLGIVVGYNDGSAKHSGIVRDVSADKWKLFKGVTTEPATTVDFTQGSLDDLEVAGFTASSITVGDVSNTEFGYLNGVTSAIQTQLDDKQPKVAGVSDTEIGYLDGVTSAIQTQIDSKAPSASPTITGHATIEGVTATGATGTGKFVFDNSPTLITPTLGVATATSINGTSIPSSATLLTSGGALGTPSSGTLTNATGLPISGLTSSTTTALGVGSIELGHASDTTIARSAAGKVTIEGNEILVSGGALGTPSSATLTNATGLPISGLTSSTSTALGLGSIELGHATDTTISRVSAGVVAIEGVNIVTTSSTDTLTNKTLGSAIGTTAFTLNAQAELRLADSDSSNYVGFKSPATVTANKIWTLPSTDGTAGQALTTNGSGTLSWSASGGGAAFSELMLIGA